MLTASLLWYLKFKKDLENMNGYQNSVRFHVDDHLSSHVDPKVNDRFQAWLEKMYGKYKAVEPTRGKNMIIWVCWMISRKKGRSKLTWSNMLSQ